jgi:hypothetical protein
LIGINRTIIENDPYNFWINRTFFLREEMQLFFCLNPNFWMIPHCSNKIYYWMHNNLRFPFYSQSHIIHSYKPTTPYMVETTANRGGIMINKVENKLNTFRPFYRP